MNVQVLADVAGRLGWASPALPGVVHDLTVACAHGLIDALTGANVLTFADRGYQGGRRHPAPSRAAAPACPVGNFRRESRICLQRFPSCKKQGFQ